MPMFRNTVNATSIIANNITNYVTTNIDASGIVKPLIKDLVIPMVENFGPPAIIGGTCVSVSRRTGRAVLEYYAGKCSLRNPRFWLRAGAAASTTASALFQAYGNASAITGHRAQWAATAGMSLEALTQTLEGKADLISVII